MEPPSRPFLFACRTCHTSKVKCVVLPGDRACQTCLKSTRHIPCSFLHQKHPRSMARITQPVCPPTLFQNKLPLAFGHYGLLRVSDHKALYLEWCKKTQSMETSNTVVPTLSAVDQEALSHEYEQQTHWMQLLYQHYRKEENDEGSSSGVIADPIFMDCQQ